VILPVAGVQLDTPQPAAGESMHLEIHAKQPCQGMHTRVIQMNAGYRQDHEPQPDAYEALLADIIRGDATNFIRFDEVEWAWRVVDPILRFWNRSAISFTATPPAAGPEEATACLKAKTRCGARRCETRARAQCSVFSAQCRVLRAGRRVQSKATRRRNSVWSFSAGARNSSSMCFYSVMSRTETSIFSAARRIFTSSRCCADGAPRRQPQMRCSNVNVSPDSNAVADGAFHVGPSSGWTEPTVASKDSR